MSGKIIIYGLLALMALANVLYALFVDSDRPNRIFTFEVSKIVYLAFWSILTVLMCMEFFKLLRNKKPKS